MINTCLRTCLTQGVWVACFGLERISDRLMILMVMMMIIFTYLFIYLMMHSVNFIRKRGNALFNDTLNTFYLRLYRVKYFVEDHSARQEPTTATTRGTLSHQQQGFFHMHHPRQDSTYHSLCYTNHGTLVGVRISSMSPPWGINPTTHHIMIGHSTIELHLSLNTYIYWSWEYFYLKKIQWHWQGWILI